MSTSTLSRPGWYPDMDHPGQQRYWDGQSWILASEDGRPVKDRQTNHSAMLVVAGAGLLVAVVCVVASGLWEGRTMSALLMGVAFIWGMSAGYVFAWAADNRANIRAAANR
jgi:hypothetical protein